MASPDSLLSVSQGWSQDVDHAVALIWILFPASDCWQNSVTWGCRTEVPFLGRCWPGVASWECPRDCPQVLAITWQPISSKPAGESPWFLPRWSSLNHHNVITGLTLPSYSQSHPHSRGWDYTECGHQRSRNLGGHLKILPTIGHKPLTHKEDIYCQLCTN